MALGSNIKKQSDREPPGPVKSVTSREEIREKEPAKPDKAASETKGRDIPPETPGREPEKINKEIEKGESLAEGKALLIVFPVEEEEYAISIDMVSEVIKTPPMATIPQAPKYILGVTNVRGNVVAILDLAMKVGLTTETDSSRSNYILVIQSEEYKIGVAVSQVPDTVMVDRSEIDSSSNVMVQSAQDQNYIKGIIKRDQRMIILVDILEMISEEETKVDL